MLRALIITCLLSSGAAFAQEPSGCDKFRWPIDRECEDGGVYMVSISTYAWIDAIQNDKYARTLAFSGATDCDSIRKTVKYRLDTGPLTIQLTGVNGNTIAVAITPSAE